jgi:protein tyrosine phosphatase (PTP) superfamily phosphohydrolase (DUF442 family)
MTTTRSPRIASLATFFAVFGALSFTTGVLPGACADEPAVPVMGDPPVAPPAEPAKDPKPATVGKDVAHMHNVHQITPRFVRGSGPETDEDFAAIAKMGVKVVVSVDGSRPPVELAHKYGLRYVHVPMGYEGPSRSELVLLYKAFTTLEGPFYVHCHHGKHRGPAACGIGLMAVEGWTAEQVVAELKRAGTASKYSGLYGFAAAFEKPTPEELAAAPQEIPEVAPVLPFTAMMVEIDHGWDRLGQVRKATWQAPPDHPDVAPAHEATIFAEYFRELARCDRIKGGAADLIKHTKESEAAAWELAKALEGKPVDAAIAEAAYKRIESSCTACHQQFRDTPAGAAAR